MVVPFYVCGLAENGKDKPFHVLDAQLRAQHQKETFETGADAGTLMSQLAKSGRQDGAEHHVYHPIPHLCPGEVEEHQRTCGDVCDHDKQCGANKNMWYTIDEQSSALNNVYAGELSDRLAQHLIRFYVDDTQRMRSELAASLRTHGDVVLRRWRKMSKDKRGKLLAHVSPSAFGSWPVKVGICANSGCYEEHFYACSFAPWLSLRDMADDWMRLVSALHVRTYNDAASWSTFDIQQGVPCWVFSDIPAWFSAKCVAMCGNKYATLSNFDPELAHRSAVFGFPRAFMTMQSQHELMYTLQNVTTAIISGCEGTGADAWTTLISGGLHPAGYEEAWNAYTHQAFTDPVHFDPAQLEAKAKDRLRMIQDELFLMQTDPMYTAELLRTKRVATSNVSSNLARKEQLHHAGVTFMLEHFHRYLIWHLVASRCHELAETFITTEIAAKWHCYQLHQLDGQLYINETKELDPSKPADRLRWRIKDLRTESVKAERMSLSQSFAAALRDDKSAKLMDKPTRDHISDMMVLDDMRILVMWSQRGRNFEDEDDGVESRWKKIEKNCCQYDDPDCRPPKLVFDTQWQQRVGVLVQKFMDAPWPRGKKDLLWLTKANESRSRLARLWDGVAKEYEKAERAGGKYSAAGSQFIASITAFKTDGSYLASLEQERLMCEEESRRAESIADQHFKELQGYTSQSEWGSTPVDSLPYRSRKSKPAPEVMKQVPKPVATVSRADLAVKQESIPVTKASLDIFRQMYRADSECLAGVSLRWSSFVQAMKDANFTAQEASGSAVTFKKSGGSISFHRPHPDPVLDHIMLYGMAKRLTKWFGFNSELFVLREKSVEEGSN